MIGTLGVMVAAAVSYLLVHQWLSPHAGKGFGSLAGSWIDDTGNMAAATELLATPAEQFSLTVLADKVIYIVCLPILLASKTSPTDSIPR